MIFTLGKKQGDFFLRSFISNVMRNYDASSRRNTGLTFLGQ